MAARYVTVCDQQYNKTQFSKKWSSLVASYEVGTSVSKTDSEFLTDVLRRIPRFLRIIEKGDPTYKIVNKVFNGKKVKGIVMVTPNSRFELWAGKQAAMKILFPPVKPRDPGKENRKKALKAMRSIIEPQIKEFRRRFAGKSVIKSSLTGKPIFGAYHVDHVYPFIRLVEEWCRENGYDLETIPVKCMGVNCQFDSIDMAESWFDYHSFHAEFQVLDAKENVSKGSRYFGKSKDSIE
jgi:hypothetical protein